MIDFELHPQIAPCGSKFDPEKYFAAYKHDYLSIFSCIATEELPSIQTYRSLVLNDLFFVLYFVMGIPIANHPFIVKMCQMVEDGPNTNTLDIWARNHFKSSIITVAETIQLILTQPELCHCILSYSKTAADKFTLAIKNTLESQMLIGWFPDVLYQDPCRESPSWSIQNGITVRRKSISRPQQTVNSYGLVEGAPTGGHWDRLVFDDTETQDMGRSVEQIKLLRDSFEMAQNLGMPDGTRVRVIGTYYTHAGLLTFLRDKKHVDGYPMYIYRPKPATDDGTATGKPVFLSQEELDKKKGDSSFNSQQLCNPTPLADILLNFNHLNPIDPEELRQGKWKNRFKFLLIDQAGDKDTKKGLINPKGDPWAIGIFSVVPPESLDLDGQGIPEESLGLADVCLEELIADQMGNSEAIDTIVRMYLKGGIIRQVGVEKVALSTTETHVHDALKTKGYVISEERGTLFLLRPASRPLEKRVMDALSHPLVHGHLYYSTGIHPKYRDLLKTEMDNFPVFHANILNIWGYLFDMLKEYKFTKYVGKQSRDKVLEKLGTMIEECGGGDFA